jgi:hypothetical protein
MFFFSSLKHMSRKLKPPILTTTRMHTRFPFITMFTLLLGSINPNVPLGSLHSLKDTHVFTLKSTRSELTLPSHTRIHVFLPSCSFGEQISNVGLCHPIPMSIRISFMLAPAANALSLPVMTPTPLSRSRWLSSDTWLAIRGIPRLVDNSSPLCCFDLNRWRVETAVLLLTATSGKSGRDNL